MICHERRSVVHCAICLWNVPSERRSILRLIGKCSLVVFPELMRACMCRIPVQHFLFVSSSTWLVNLRKEILS